MTLVSKDKLPQGLVSSRLVPEDIGFFQILGKNGTTMRFDHTECGGAISNAQDTKNIPRRKRFQAVSCSCGPVGHVACPVRPVVVVVVLEMVVMVMVAVVVVVMAVVVVVVVVRVGGWWWWCAWVVLVVAMVVAVVMRAGVVTVMMGVVAVIAPPDTPPPPPPLPPRPPAAKPGVQASR